MKKFRNACILVLIIVLTLGMSVFAANNGVLESYTGESSVSLYVRGGATGDLSAQVGTGTADTVTAQSISEIANSVKTLVMIDNSISVKEADRKKISEFMQDFISDRMPNESISIATFDEDIRYICDYSSDYAELKRAGESVEYKNQETYLTDVLYPIVEKMTSDNEDVFQRIIIISDGVDNKSLGITKEELYSSIKSNPVVIYTIGSLNKKKSNNNELEDMFALSRMTGGEAILLEDTNDTLSIVEKLKVDSQIVKYSVYPSADQMDGSVKGIKLSAGGATYDVECRMPQQLVEYVAETPDTPEPTVIVVTESVAPTPPPVEEKGFPVGLLIGIIAALLVVAGAIVAVVLILKKKNSGKEFASVVEEEIRTVTDIGDDSERTVVLGMDNNYDDDGRTMVLWNDRGSKTITLTDKNTSARAFSFPSADVIRIGRSAGNDVVIDYDKSISGKHCEIKCRDGRYYIRDVGSSNHTYVNGNEVLSEVELFAGNVIKLGRVEMIFEVR